MTSSSEQLASVLFGGQRPPGRDTLLNQGFTRDPAKTKKALPDARLWPPELDQAPVVHGRFRIDRRLVFHIAERAVATPDDEWSAGQLHTAIVIWGAKPGMPMTRAFRPLANPEAPTQLTKALRVVRSEGPVSAYRALVKLPRGRLYVPHLGASYFTKFLYFAGWDAKPLLAQPLILDDLVIKSLATLTKESWKDESPNEYIRYLDLARDVAREADTTEDIVEWQLWRSREAELTD
jgi:hypothetical protein